MMKGRGCTKPAVAPHLIKLPFRLHAAALRTATPSAVDLRETGLIAAVKDQGPTSSCEGHSCSGATESALALAGDPLGFTPSEIDPYRGARSIERARYSGGALTPLTDNGAQTEDVLSYLAAFGIRPRSIERTSDGRNSDVEVLTVNAELSLGELEADAQRVVVGPYAINPASPDAESLVEAAITAKIPVRVDAFVDTVFEDWSPGRPPVPAPNINDANGGGHAIYIVGFAPGLYIVRNSWGTSVGDAGDYLVSPEWLRASWGLYPWAARRAA